MYIGLLIHKQISCIRIKNICYIFEVMHGKECV